MTKVEERSQNANVLGFSQGVPSRHNDEEYFWDEVQANALDSDDTLGLYLAQVQSVPLLKHNEEVELAQQIERGRRASRALVRAKQDSKRMLILECLVKDGQKAREHLLLANVRLVFSVALKYAQNGIPLMDLVQEGHIGLMRATKKFDYRRGYKFSTYAMWWIRQSISRYVADHGRTIRIPVHMGTRINRMLRARHRSIQALGREPTIDELAEELDEPEEVVGGMLIYAQRAISLDSSLSTDDDNAIVDFVESEDPLDPEEVTTRHLLKEDVNEMLGSLPVREAKVLRLRYGLSGGYPHTLHEIGEKFGITRERVRQIEAQAKKRIRRYGLQDPLKGYLWD